MINKNEIKSINSDQEFKEKYGEDRVQAVFEIITEAFYNDEYQTKSTGVEILSHDKESIGSPQNPQYEFAGSVLFDNKVFYFQISDGIGNGTEINDFYLDKEETYDHLVEKNKKSMKRKSRKF